MPISILILKENGKIVIEFLGNNILSPTSFRYIISLPLFHTFKFKTVAKATVIFLRRSCSILNRSNALVQIFSRFF